MPRFNPVMTLSAICLVGVSLNLAGCANQAADGLKVTAQSVDFAHASCATMPPPVPGHEAPYWDCMREATKNSPDATLAAESAAQAQYAEAFDAGKMDLSAYDSATANLRERDQIIYSSRQQAAQQTSNQNLVGAGAGLLAAADIALAIFTMVNY